MTTATRYPRRGGRRPLLPCRMEETRKHVASTSNPMAFPDQLGADHDDIEVRPAPTWRPPLPTKPLIWSYFLFSFILARPSSPVTSPPLLPWVLSETCSVPSVEKPPSHPSCSCRPDEMATSAPRRGWFQGMFRRYSIIGYVPSWWVSPYCSSYLFDNLDPAIQNDAAEWSAHRARGLECRLMR